MYPSRVLVVDDDEMENDLLKLILEGEGHIVEVSNDGKSAFKKAEDRSLDIVIMDYNLPDMKGDDLAIKMNELYPSLRFFLLSGINLAVTPLHFLGFEKVFEKPVDPQILIQQLNQRT